MKNSFRFIVYGATDTKEFQPTALAGANSKEEAREIIYSYYANTSDLFYSEAGEQLATFGIYDSEKEIYLKTSDFTEFKPI